MVQFVGLRNGPSNFAEAIKKASDQRMAAMLTEWMTTATAMAMANREKQSFSDVDDLRSTALCCIISDMFGGWTHVVAKKFAIPSLPCGLRCNATHGTKNFPRSKFSHNGGNA